jgi:hypothetical protein
MNPLHLHGLVKRGRWLDAVEYLDRYLPPPSTIPRSYHAQVLRQFLVTHQRFANAVDGIVDSTSLPRNYLQLNNGRAVGHAKLRLHFISFSILAVAEVRYVISVYACGQDRFVPTHKLTFVRIQRRANMNWERVRERASIVVSRLARSTPELRGCIALPATNVKPHHVLPIASGYVIQTQAKINGERFEMLSKQSHLKPL